MHGIEVARLESEGLKYEKLEIKELRLDLVDPRRGHGEEHHEHHHKGHHHDKEHLGAIRLLGEELEELGRRLVSGSRDKDHD